MRADLHLFAVPGIPEVDRGDDLGALIADAVVARAARARDGDVVVVAQKIVSKAEGAIVRLDEVAPSPRAREWAAAHGKDPSVVEVILRESRRIVRMDRGILIAETHHGFVCANAGVDASNVPPGFVTVLPRDPDASAAAPARRALSAASGCPVGVIVSDTFGRPWREGVRQRRARRRRPAAARRLSRLHGSVRPARCTSTVIALADELASRRRNRDAEDRAACRWRSSAARPNGPVTAAARALVRAAEPDLFR